MKILGIIADILIWAEDLWIIYWCIRYRKFPSGLAEWIILTMGAFLLFKTITGGMI